MPPARPSASAIAAFERARIAERVRLGLARVRAQGKRLGRPRVEIDEGQLAQVAGLSIRQAARHLGVSPATLSRRLHHSSGRQVQPPVAGV